MVSCDWSSDVCSSDLQRRWFNFQLVAIKCAPTLKVKPPSLIKINALIPQCTIKKDIRNKPVIPIINFFPIDEERAFPKPLI